MAATRSAEAGTTGRSKGGDAGGMFKGLLIWAGIFLVAWIVLRNTSVQLPQLLSYLGIDGGRLTTDNLPRLISSIGVLVIVVGLFFVAANHFVPRSPFGHLGWDTVGVGVILFLCGLLGPTLLAWMGQEAPLALRDILDNVITPLFQQLLASLHVQ